MKMKVQALILSLVTSGLVSFAQDNNVKPANPAPQNPAPAVEPAKVDPAKAEPAKDEPVKADPAKPEPAKAEPAAVPPVAQPGLVQAAPAQPAPPPGAAVTPATPNPSEVIPLIQIEEVPLTDAIRNLARQSNLNFQFDPRITTTNQANVSIRFENVTAQEALSAVLDNYNLQLVKDPRSKIARVTIKDPKAEEPLVSRIVQLKYSDPTNLVGLVKSTLSARSQVIADPRTSQLLVSTTDKEMDAVEALVAKLDTPTKQVLIEARLYETARNPSTVKG